MIISGVTPNLGQGKLPQKNDSKVTVYKRKEVKTAQISPLATKNAGVISGDSKKKIFLGNDDFYAENERDGDKKLVNISIDELNEEEIERQVKV